MIRIYTFHIITLGCRVNQYESRSVAEKLCSMGMTESESADNCDLYIINTCAVTAESSRKSRQMIRRAASASKDPVVIVMGCWSQIEPEKAEELGCADIIVGAGDKQSVCESALELLKNRSALRGRAAKLAPLAV